MNKDSDDYKLSVDVAIKNAKHRITLIKKTDQKCIMEEYKEWIKNDFDYKSVLLLREDPII